MADLTIAESLTHQFSNTLDVLRETIGLVPDAQWTVGESPSRIPARQACHIIGGCDMYSAKDRFAWDRRFGAPVGLMDKDVPAERLPSKDAMVAYLDDTRDQVAQWLAAMAPEQLLTPQESSRQRCRCALGHVIYVLRHTALHLGHLHAELNTRGIGHAEFK